MSARKPSTLVPVSLAAKEKGVDPSAVRHAIREGRLKAEKVGSQWVMRPSDLEKWQPKRQRKEEEG